MAGTSRVLAVASVSLAEAYVSQAKASGSLWKPGWGNGNGNGRTNELTKDIDHVEQDRLLDGWMDGRTERCITDGWTDLWMVRALKRQMGGISDLQTHTSYGEM